MNKSPPISDAFRIPALDGLRAFSVMLVIFWHIEVMFNHGKLPSFFWRIDPGPTGVSIFFVISGYLITILLQKEKASHGKINLFGFYIRRMYRILPAYLFYIASVVLLKEFQLLNIEWPDISAALFFITNYVSVDWILTHTWSLSVEEQFYLIYPILLIRVNKKYVISVLLIMLAVSIVARYLGDVIGISYMKPRYSFEGRADQLAFGCLCAYAQISDLSKKYTHFTKYIPYFSILALGIAIGLPPGTIRLLTFNTFIGLATALLIYYCTICRESLITRILDIWPMRWIGILSYSLYLWQQAWLDPYFALSATNALIGTFASALFSYFIIEKTGFRWRKMNTHQ